MDTLYIERDVVEHPRTRRILSLYPDATRIICERYGEVFNRRSQSFRLQKHRPALIVARKIDNHVLEIGQDYGIGGERNFHFSPMLNCVHDCRYCYLQGAHPSAHYLIFVNYEDFADAIRERVREAPGNESHFFSGFGCDSLAFDSVTGFCDYFVRIFEQLSDARLELRTKSGQVQSLLERRAVSQVVVAFSLAPRIITRALEHGTATLERRLQAMRQLAERGWQLGLRLDPLIYYRGYREGYQELLDDVFLQLTARHVHSVTLGVLRFPKAVFARIVELYPEERLLAGPLCENDGMVSYPEPIRDELIRFCEDRLLQQMDKDKIFRCHGEPRIS